jgi:5-methylthioadenosine/S-adenosylhomocysteine deaminase
MGRELLRGGIVLSMDPSVGDFDSGDVRIDEGRIVEVGEGLEAEGASVVDCRGTIVMPGMIDTHRHLWYTPYRNLSADLTLWPFFKQAEVVVPGYNPDWVYGGELLGALDCLDGGITTVMDWCHVINKPAHADAAIKAVTEVGGRVRFAYGMQGAGWDSPSGNGLPEDMLRVQQEYFAEGAESLVTYCVGLRGPDYVDFEQCRREMQGAREAGIPITMHIAVLHEYRESRGVARLRDEGMLGRDQNFVHLTFTTDDEFQAIAEAGATISICPTPEQAMGFGDPPFRRALRNGVVPSLGLDSCVAGGGYLFDDMHHTLMETRRQEMHEAWDRGEEYIDVVVKTREILEMGTIAGARALWLDDLVGSLTPGKQADVITLRTSDLNMMPVSNVEDAMLAATLSARSANVDSVWVGGRRVKEGGRLTVDVDVERGLALSVEARAAWPR